MIDYTKPVRVIHDKAPLEVLSTALKGSHPVALYLPRIDVVLRADFEGRIARYGRVMPPGIENVPERHTRYIGYNPKKKDFSTQEMETPEAVAASYWPIVIEVETYMGKTTARVIEEF